MKTSVSVDSSSRSAMPAAPEIRDVASSSAGTCLDVRTDVAHDPALSPLRSPPARRSSETTLATLPAITDPESRALAPQPVVSADTATTTLARLHRQLIQDDARPIAADLAADLISRLRPMKAPAADGAQRAATYADLVSRISEKDVMDWYKAQGLSESDVFALRRATLLSGLPNPSGSFLTNSLQYIVAPWVNYQTGKPWFGAGIGIGTAFAAAPVAAVHHPTVVTLCESIREHGGHTIVPDKKEFNDKHWLPDLAQALEKKIATFAKACDAFREIQNAPDASTEEYVDSARTLLAAEKELHLAQHDFVMTQGAHDRQWKGNRWQAIPRILRSPVASALGLLTKTNAMRALSPTAQTVGAILMTAAQHVAAGFDEQAKQESNNVLNLLYANVFTASGKEKIARGAPLMAADIDTGKLRKLIESPLQNLVKRVAKGLALVEKELAEEVKKMERPQGAPDADDLDLEAGHGSGPARKLSLLRNDLQALRERRLDELDPNGLASKLLIGAEKSVLSAQLFNDIIDKYSSRELSAQTCQRIGQTFQLVVFGSAASSVIGKVASAAQGGARNVPVAESLAITALSGGMAAVGALNQHVATSLKCHRRDTDVDIGWKAQTLRGIMGTKHEALAQRRGTKASKAINALLEDNDVEALLVSARELVAQAPSTSASSHNPSSSTSAREQLRPVQQPAAQISEIVPESEAESATFRPA
ncbi:putative type III effector protein XopN class [Xanthomonas bromi]|uniref:Putative type III effector protein XopN class n=1 Tax=Xanthomonas bromi TaxID=56449 RepID=A0A1C3NKR4_9XANT|nr:type III secretion system effector XopN [Xanthomonas bromi]PPV07525.1 type III secretion system effector protein [Xanthomonas bromi]SBV51003.1 putative type III effector protein XopN class [Xanthomonas bromi]